MIIAKNPCDQPLLLEIIGKLMPVSIFATNVYNIYIISSATSVPLTPTDRPLFYVAAELVLSDTYTGQQ